MANNGIDTKMASTVAIGTLLGMLLWTAVLVGVAVLVLLPVLGNMFFGAVGMAVGITLDVVVALILLIAMIGGRHGHE